MKKYFIIDESPTYPGKCRVCLASCNLPFVKPRVGSYNVLAARIMGLDWIDFLRYCRDVYGAEIVGKNSIYPVAYFDNENKPYELMKELNKRTEKILKNLQFI